MAHVAFVIPGDIGLPTGGYAYDRRVLALLPRSGVTVEHLALPGSFPQPGTADLDMTANRLAAVPADTVLLIDGLAYGAMPARVIDTIRGRIIALVHHPLCLEAGTSKTRQAELRQLETAALARAARVIVTSNATARTLVAEFAVPADRITVAEPGTDPAPRARGSFDAKAISLGASPASQPDARVPLQLLAVGSIIPRKGYDILIDALAPLRALPWQLDIAGAPDLSPQTTREILSLIETHKIADRIRLLGAVEPERLAELYDRADLFVMASHYEGFGMVLTEALARGLPIVCTVGGAAADTLPDEAALKCQPGDARGLMWPLGRLIEDKSLRARYADAAWAAAQSLPRWPDTAQRVAYVIKEVAA